MKKTFCDYCEQEITDANAVPGQQLHLRLRKNNRLLRVKVMVANNAAFAAADACLACVLEAAKQPPETPATADVQTEQPPTKQPSPPIPKKDR